MVIARGAVVTAQKVIANLSLNIHLVEVRKVVGVGQIIGHKLYCLNAKLWFSIQFETVVRTEDDVDSGVLLQVMKIPSISSSKSYETVIWDTACTWMFVRHSHAREMEFP